MKINEELLNPIHHPIISFLYASLIFKVLRPTQEDLQDQKTLKELRKVPEIWSAKMIEKFTPAALVANGNKEE